MFMTPAADDLPEDLDALKRRVVALSAENERLWDQYTRLRHEELHSPGSTFGYLPVPLVPSAASPYWEQDGEATRWL